MNTATSEQNWTYNQSEGQQDNMHMIDFQTYLNVTFLKEISQMNMPLMVKH